MTLLDQMRATARADLRTVRAVMDLVRPQAKTLVAALSMYVIATASALAVPMLCAVIIDEALPRRDISRIRLTILVVLAVTVVSAVAGLLRELGLMAVGSGITARLRRRLYETTTKVDGSTLNRWGVGYWLARIDGDVSGTSVFSGQMIAGTVESAVSLCAGMIAMYVIDSRLALIVTCSVPPLFFITCVASTRVSETTGRVREAWADYLGNVEEDIRNHTLRKAWGLCVRRTRTAGRRLEIARRKEMRLFASMRAVSAVVNALQILIPVMVLWEGFSAVGQGRLSLGRFVAFNSYLAYVTGPMQQMIDAYRNLRLSTGNYSRIEQVLDLRVECIGAGVPTAATPIRFQDLAVRYAGSAAPAISGVSAEIQPREWVGFVGPNASGKSTLLKCIPLLVEPTSGCITFDDVPHDSVDRAWLRRQVAYCPSDVQFYRGTILGNIAQVVPKRSIAEVEAALEDLGFFENGTLRATLFLRVSDMGKCLSQGQIQLIGLARALLRGAPVLVLDEATSCLDVRRRERLPDVIRKWLPEATALIASHHVSDMSSCGRIIAIVAGHVACDGPSDEALAARGWYQEWSASGSECVDCQPSGR